MRERSDSMIRCTRPLMGTLVTIEARRSLHPPVETSIERAFDWFVHVEDACSRFNPASELARLTRHVGTPVTASPVLFEAVRFAVAVADATAGAFDPTVGAEVERRGFDKDYRTGARIETLVPAVAATYRDVVVDERDSTILLRRPLLLDLGAVAKGLAIDMAARELMPLGDFVVDAGGDLFAGGCHEDGLPWSIGIRHPRRDGEIIARVNVSNQAVCTSGDYERREIAAAPHIVDPRDPAAPPRVASATVVAPTALAADAFATAAFVLGPEAGIAWLEEQGVHGVIVGIDLTRRVTRGMDIDFDPNEAAAAGR